MEVTDWHIRIIDPGYKFTREIYIFRRLPNNDVMMIDGTIVKAEEANAKPSMELTPEQLQAFANALDKNGFKPQEGFTEGKLEATERHLTDLRKLLKL